MDKRKCNYDSAAQSINKKPRADITKYNGKFTEGCIPYGVFPIGNDVFVLVNTYHNSISVHIRQFKKYGKTYYPTKEGITLIPKSIESIIGIKKVPESTDELPGGFLVPEKFLQITSKNFKEFIFKRIRYGVDNVPSSKEITISREQWSEMLKNCDAIMNAYLDETFQSIDFLNAFKVYCETPIEKILPLSLDISLGQEYLVQVLKESISSLLKERGIKLPITLAEELWGNRVETFNSHVIELEANELAESFYSNLFKSQNFLKLQPVNYVTEEFLVNLRMNVIIKELREMFCPPDCFEYYEDFPPDFV